MDTFSYNPLQAENVEIRLLKLLAGCETSDVECQLIHTPLNENSDYEALSYTWGSETPLKTISLNGHNFNIRENLDSALRHLRLKDKPRMMWVDAICINQRDNQEKAREVRRMRDIYSRAQNVVVWLGNYHEPRDHDVDGFFSKMGYRRPRGRD
jgi:hypothetical protein